MRIIYVTAQTPWSDGETFILPEILEIIRQGHTVNVIPIRPNKALGSGQLAGEVVKFATRLSLFGPATLSLALREWIRHPGRVLSAIKKVWTSSGSPRKGLKNLAVVPKGLAIAQLTREFGADHIHAHWASTPSTAAYIAGKLSETSWSFTCHRWDIAENNMLKEKATDAKLIRAVHADGKSDIDSRIGTTLSVKTKVIHMGVDIPAVPTDSDSPQTTSNGTGAGFVLACPANFVPVKGHRYLIDACRILVERDRDFYCLLVGDGPLSADLHRQVSEYDLADHVGFTGRLPHHELLARYAQRTVQAVVLPSIMTDHGEQEAVPVSLMEAMAYEIPVIATATGGIRELISDDAGIIVPEKDAPALADAIEGLIVDARKREKLAKAGREQAIKLFDIRPTVHTLLIEIGTPKSQRIQLRLEDK